MQMRIIKPNWAKNRTINLLVSRRLKTHAYWSLNKPRQAWAHGYLAKSSPVRLKGITIKPKNHRLWHWFPSGLILHHLAGSAGWGLGCWGQGLGEQCWQSPGRLKVETPEEGRWRVLSWVDTALCLYLTMWHDAGFGWGHEAWPATYGAESCDGEPSGLGYGRQNSCRRPPQAESVHTLNDGTCTSGLLPQQEGQNTC